MMIGSRGRAEGEDLFRRYLLPGEHLVWMDRPDPHALFTTADLFLVPFSILWAGFAVFSESSVIAGRAPLFFMLWGIPFVLVGAYITVGRFVYKRIAQRHTYDAVTNQRVLSLNTLLTHHLQAAFIRSLPTISISGSDHRGTVQFGQPPSYASWIANTGWGFFGPSAAGLVAFYNIPDPQHVYNLVSRQVVDWDGDR